MDKKFRVIFLFFAAVVFLAAVVLVYSFVSDELAVRAGYSVVYLKSGEVYIGKLSLFPKMEFTDVYLLKVAQGEQDPAKLTSMLQPLNEADWAPKKLFLVKENVLFYGPLKETSRAAEALMKSEK